MEKKTIIFVYPHKASFIQLDIEILSEKYFVIQNTYNWKNTSAIPINMVRQTVFLLRKIRQAKLIVVSFGGYWALIPSLIGRLFKKPVYIILHGADCVSFPEINYGSLRKPVLRKTLKFTYKMASRLLPVSKSLIYTENTYFDENKLVKQGYKYFFKNITTEETVIFNGISAEKWHRESVYHKQENRFLTVFSEGQFIRKGGELVVEAARKLPDFEFHIIGVKKPSFVHNMPSNIKFISRLTEKELLKTYNSTRYYLQLSNFEGFGYALCEAMLCECIPIVSNVNMMPEIVGDTGYVLKKRNVDSLVDLIKEITGKEIKPDAGKAARNRIIENYPIEKRKQALFQVLE